jgi:Protein of unknown function (DUF2934)
MPKAKTPRSTEPVNSANKQVITMPEAGTVPIRRSASIEKPIALDLEGQIRQRAYELYEERGRTPGRETDDWVQAEREVHARSHQQQRA